MPDNWVFATGRRKTSVARVMIRSGEGNVIINNHTPQEYFPTQNEIATLMKPLEVTDNIGKWDINIIVKGGGFTGQAEAVRHSIARALLEVDPDSKQALSKGKFLTRDSRMVERKKPGRPKARKNFQFSKR